MLNMEIVRYPNDLLVAKNKPLDRYTPDAAAQVVEMLKLMYRTGGVGLAAPQVGWNVRLFTLGVSAVGDPEVKHRVIWNPEIETSGELVPMREGCLSFPRIYAQIKRWTRTRLVGQTPEGPIDEVFMGLGAQAIQHEMDHLDGILFIEKMTPADRQLNDAAIRTLADQTLRKKH
jgi:peptide deformylase